MTILTDWNDLHVSAGLDAVREQFQSALEQAQVDKFAQDEIEKDSATRVASAKPETTKPLSGKKRAQRQQVSGESPLGEDPPPFQDDAFAAGNASRDMDWRYRLKRNSKGSVYPWTTNIVMILSNDEHWVDEEEGASIGYCDFSYRVIKHRETVPGCRAGEWEDADTARLKDWLGRIYGFNPSRSEVIDAVIVVAQRHRFHPVRDYLNQLVWDGVDRTEHWLADALGAKAQAGDSSYLHKVGCMFLIGAVARVMRPGCKMDNMLILEGWQGIKKSSVIEVLFGDWFSDSPLPLGEKDAYSNIQGVWGQEIAELDSFNKAESTTAKQFFSQRRDRFRPPYGHTAQDFPRQTVFLGSTNQEEYLKDATGNRRYWPVYCEDVNVKWVRESRDQLWAEALHRFGQDEKWWPETEDEKRLFAREAEIRLQLDPWHYKIEDWLLSVTFPHVTANDVLNEAIQKDAAHITRADQNRVAPIMKALGWHKSRITIDKRQRHVYKRPEGFVSHAKPVQSTMDDSDFDLPGS